MCDKIIIKERITVKYEKYWTIDIFEGENSGLVVAEIELKKEKEKFSLPPWVTKEVSNDPRYYNVNLINNPFMKFGEKIITYWKIDGYWFPVKES